MKKIISTIFLLSLLGSGSTQLDVDEEEEDWTDMDFDPESSEFGVVPTSYQTNCTCGTSNKIVTKIVKGKPTVTNEYPFIAGLVNLEADSIYCGGTIITQRHILTAAHCLVLPIDEVKIHVGHHNYNEVKGTTVLLEPERFIKHNKYNYLKLVYDIGIILLKYPIAFNENVRPVCLPRRNLINKKGKKIKLLGWGRTGYHEDTSDVLLKVYVNIKPLEFCQADNPNLELKDRHQICTFKQDKDACEGDSGGPLLWVEKTNMYTLLGVISYGYKCAVYPAVNSDVYYFLPWIQGVISSTDGRLKTCARVKRPKKDSLINF